MKFKPFQQIDEYDKVNIFALEEQTGVKGSVVGIKHGWKNGDVDSIEALDSSINKFAFIGRNTLKARVTQVTTGNASTYKPYGITWKNVMENAKDPNQSLLIHDRTRKAELDAVTSGEAVPIVRKALVLANWGTGTGSQVAGIGSGVSVPNAANGEWVITDNTTGTNVFGALLGPKDADGYALVDVDFSRIA